MDIKKILENSKEIKVENVLNKICVSRPYFNFNQIFVNGDYMIAPVIKEQPEGSEVVNIASAEALRHIAILGSCQYANTQSEKMYYLAQSAQGHMNYKEGNFDDLFVLTRLGFDSKRTMEQVGGLYSLKNGLIHKTSVIYSKVKPKLFESIFEEHYKKYTKQEESPYKTLLDIEIKYQDSQTINAIIPPFALKKCSGHFDNYASIPVAYLAYNVVNLASRLTQGQIKMKSFTASFPNLGNPQKESTITITKKQNLINCTVSQLPDLIFELIFFI